MGDAALALVRLLIPTAADPSERATRMRIFYRRIADALQRSQGQTTLKAGLLPQTARH